jgi:hypothetical protein
MRRGGWRAGDESKPRWLGLERAGLASAAAGDDVLSHPVSRAVPSARRGLTTVFGMGTGVALAQWPPAKEPAGVGERKLQCTVLQEVGPAICGTAKPLGRLVRLG